MNGKHVIKKLESNGWRLARIDGSHHVMEKDALSVRFLFRCIVIVTLVLVC